MFVIIGSDLKKIGVAKAFGPSSGQERVGKADSVVIGLNALDNGEQNVIPIFHNLNPT